jgi:iron complex outermembrane recepter protein
LSTTQPGAVTQSGGTLSLDRKLGADWDLNLSGSYSNIDQNFFQSEIVTIPSLPGFVESFAGETKSTTGTASLDALVNGTLWSLPAGDIKTAFGATYRAEDFHTGTVAVQNGVTTDYVYPKYRRHVESVFGEVHIPLVGDANAMPFVRRLDISGSVRYDDYSDFGSTTNPKLGVEWAPTDDFTLRGTWGTSFRAPLLSDLNNPLTFAAEYLPDAAAPGGIIDTLFVGGGNPNLKAQTATVVSAGADWQPHWDSALKVSLSYSHVDYKNLIGLPPVTNGGAVFSDPVLAPFINTSPDLAYVQAAFMSPGFQNNTGLGPASVQAIFNEQDANLAAEVESNIDLRVSYAIPSDVGPFVLTGIVDHFITDTLQSAAAAPTTSIVNTFGEPMRWKGRAGVSWANYGFSAALNINYSNSYSDNLAIPAARIGSWTTGDLYLGYAVPPSDGLLQNLRFSLTVQNILDAKPPTALIPPGDVLPGQNPIPFDPVNASPMGRVIALQVTKDF